jgi:hypothetical protein
MFLRTGKQWLAVLNAVVNLRFTWSVEHLVGRFGVHRLLLLLLYGLVTRDLV